MNTTQYKILKINQLYNNYNTTNNTHITQYIKPKTHNNTTTQQNKSKSKILKLNIKLSNITLSSLLTTERKINYLNYLQYL